MNDPTRYRIEPDKMRYKHADTLLVSDLIRDGVLVPDTTLQAIKDAYQAVKDTGFEGAYERVYLFELFDALTQEDTDECCTHGLTLSNGPWEVCAECGKVVNE